VSCGLRDVVEIERSGKPAALVASAAFEDAADSQSAQLGQPGARRAYVPHPIQDRSDDELRELAGAVVEELLGALSTEPRQP
jgi:hypothetical protein